MTDALVSTEWVAQRPDEPGVRIVGLDISSAMLARAREKSAGLENVAWVEGDMRSFELGEEFAG